MGTFVDDSISEGNETLKKESEVTSEKFQCKDRIYNNFRFTVIYVENLADGNLIHQAEHIKRVKLIYPDCTTKEFRSARSKISWLQHYDTRPEIATRVNYLLK